jgi:hypothetical protein
VASLLAAEELLALIEHVVDARLALALSGVLPGKVLSYDAAKQVADVQPEPATRDEDGNQVNHPVLPDVPVVWPRGGGASLTFPLQPGDRVTLLPSAVCLDAWQKAGDVTAPAEDRRGGLSGMVALPGLYPRAQALDGVPTGHAVLAVGAGQELRLGAMAAAQALVRGNAFSTWLTTQLSVQTAFGPSGPAVAGLTAAELSTVVKVP